MKKAINFALLGILVLIASFWNLQTVVADNSGLFLSNNESNSAKDFINATKTSNQDENQVTVNSVSTYTPTVLASSSLDNKNEKKINTVDEGSLPLFSNRYSSSTRRLDSTGDNLSATFSMLTSLIAIIILALVASWFIQKKTGLASNNFGKVLGMVPIDNRRIIYIVDVMGKMLVLGVTEHNINYLTEITDKDTIDAYRLKYGQNITPGLEKLFPFINKNNSSETDEESDLDDSQKKILAEKKSEEIKNEIDENRKKREERLRNLLIKKK